MAQKKIFLIFYILGSFSLGISQSLQAADTLNFATTKVQTLTHTTTTLKEKFTGQFLLLDFWASWCAPCKESLPFYQELQKRYAAEGLQVLALSVDSDVKDASSFIRKNNFTLN
ncbi:MAG TPA: TlpA disulfide reductase family protein, partial [Pseudobdellovibrionaceae bacterium]